MIPVSFVKATHWAKAKDFDQSEYKTVDYSFSNFGACQVLGQGPDRHLVPFTGLDLEAVRPLTLISMGSENN